MSESARKISLNSIKEIYGENQPPPSSEVLKKQILLSSLASFTFGLCLYLSYSWFIYAKNNIETNNAYIEADIYQVQSRMMGYVKSLAADEDKEVKEGETLIQLDETDISVEKNVKEARFQKATADFNRAKTMSNSSLISKSDYELAEAAHIMASADLEASLLKEKYSRVVSPTDGTVAKIFVKPGQFIQPGQNLVTVISQKKFWIKANYKETQIEKIKKGQPVEIEIDAYPGVYFQGNVIGIYPSSGSILSLLPPENATGNFTKVVQRVPVKISIIEQKNFPLRPGMSVITTVKIGN